MKILIVSLLRLGDIIMHTELVPSLKKRYPGCEVHFMINSQFHFAKDLFPEVTSWHLLERERIQQILVEQNQSPQAAFESLQTCLEKINSEKFDLVLNATHNLLSVRLMDLICATEKRGASFEDGKKKKFKNQWLHYLNEQFSEVGMSRFHYLEILHRALEVPMKKIPFQKRKASGPILIQALTADAKKNWGLEKFKLLKEKILEKNPQEKIFVLGSPQEKDELKIFFSDEEILITSLTEAKEILSIAKLLITGDTSIQHLAAKVACPTVAVHLGSADPIKTSSWLIGSQVVQGNSVCYPCRASEKCSQASHLCGRSVTVEQLGNQVLKFLEKTQEPQILENGEHHFFAGEGANLGLQKLEQLVWGFYLEGHIAEDVFILPDIGLIDAFAIKKYEKLQSQLEKLNEKIETLSQSIFKTPQASLNQALTNEIKMEVQVLADQYPEIADSFLKMRSAFEIIDQSFFEFLKVLRTGFRESQNLNALRQRLISIELRKPEHVDRMKKEMEDNL